MLRNVVVVPLALTAVVMFTRTVDAIPQFQKVFFEQYVESSEDEDWVDLAKKQAKCYICHQGKKSKKNRNAYGEQLSELLDRKEDKNDTEKIIAALEEVAEMHTDPEDEESPTYGDRIAEGNLPAGELDDLKEEPSEEEE